MEDDANKSGVAERATRALESLKIGAGRFWFGAERYDAMQKAKLDAAQAALEAGHIDALAEYEGGKVDLKGKALAHLGSTLQQMDAEIAHGGVTETVLKTVIEYAANGASNPWMLGSYGIMDLAGLIRSAAAFQRGSTAEGLLKLVVTAVPWWPTLASQKALDRTLFRSRQKALQKQK